LTTRTPSAASKVELVSHDPNWAQAFATEADAIARALSDKVVAIHHIGSTAIPSICAKPVLDLLVEVESLAHVDDGTAALEALGYEAMGEFGIPERRFFRKDDARGIRTHHVHVFLAGSSQVTRHLAFRDYLRVHPEDAQRYDALKRALAERHEGDRDAYVLGKDPFIKEIDAKAARFFASRISAPSG
jgi:GrpB-like predicted nucleotidyltransferase (UPF0157 family)